MKRLICYALSALMLLTTACSSPKAEYDVCVYGGTSAGVIAAYAVAKQGKKVLFVEPGQRLGGMSSGGLGQTDIGNKQVVKGLALDFYRRVGAHYGRLESWIFEPSVAENIFKDYIARGNVEVLYDHRIVGVQKQGATIKSISLENVKGEPMTEISAKQFIDCTYEGDLMARAGVSYVVGREDNKVYGEDHNGVQMQHLHQFVDNVDPYVEKGNPASGLLWGISDAALAATGSGDKMVQAYNLNEEKRIFYRKLFKVGFPVLIQQIVSIGLNLVDTIMVGKVSENALAAVGAANQVYFIYSVVIFGIFSGASVYAVQYWGLRDLPSLRKILGIDYLMCILVTIPTVIGAYLAAPQLIWLFSDEPEVISLGTDYIRIACFSYVFSSLSFVISFNSIIVTIWTRHIIP